MLFIYLFVMVFGPKTPTVDWASVAALGPVVHLAVVWPRRLITPHKWVVGLFVWAALGVCFAAAGAALNNSPDYFHTLRFGRVALVVVGCYALVALCALRYRSSDEAHVVLIRWIAAALCLHAGVILAMALSRDIASLVLEFYVQAPEDSSIYQATITGRRVSGLVTSLDATSGLQAFGLVLVVVLWWRARTVAGHLSLLVLPLLLLSILVSGRTGLVILLLLSPLPLVIRAMRPFQRSRSPLGVKLISAALTFAMLSVTATWGGDFLYQHLEFYGREFSLDDGADLVPPTLRTIAQDHYFLPEDWSTFLWGTGGSGRSDYSYVAADPGLVLNLFGVGVFGWIWIYSPYALGVVLSLRRLANGSSSPSALPLLLISVTVIAIDAKVSYALARNGLPVFMLLLQLQLLHSVSRRRSAGIGGTDPSMLCLSTASLVSPKLTPCGLHAHAHPARD